MTNNLTGKKFGMLTVIARAGSNAHKKAVWLCRCECGNESTHIGSGLLSGHTSSCGCQKLSGLSQLSHGHTVGGKPTRAYRCWKNMHLRCSNPNYAGWKNYGGRGISVCHRWDRFENFLQDMGEPPEDGTLSIDRIKNWHGYSPGNCKWSTRSQQRRNSRGRKVYVSIDGERMILMDAVRLKKIVSYQAAVNRIHRGWSPYDAVMTPYTRSDNKGYRDKWHSP